MASVCRGASDARLGFKVAVMIALLVIVFTRARLGYRTVRPRPTPARGRPGRTAGQEGGKEAEPDTDGRRTNHLERPEDHGSRTPKNTVQAGACFRIEQQTVAFGSAGEHLNLRGIARRI